MRPDLNQLRALIQGAQWGRARTLGVRLCEGNPGDADAWYLLAGVNAQLGRMDDVVACCERVVALQPDHVGALYNLGVALQTEHQNERAVRAYEKALSFAPAHPLARAGLGLALRDLGRSLEAEENCRAALAHAPDLPEAWNTLGLSLKDQGRLEPAAEAFQQALRCRSRYAEALFNLGLCRQAQGMTAEAEASYRRALEVRPAYFDAHARLGALLAGSGKSDAALAHYRHALELSPDSVEVCTELANLLVDQDTAHDHHAEAERCYRKALELRPDLPEVHVNLAVMLNEKGAAEEAATHFRRALELRPGYTEARAGLATVLERKGNFQEGIALLRQDLASGAPGIHVALAYAALARHRDERPQAVALLERLVDTPMQPRQQVELHFTLGRLYDELKQHSRAFEHVRRANELEPVRFDEAGTKASFDELIDVFSEEAIRRRPRASNQSRLPVFIVGMPRSGTSLVEQILASHPDVYGAGELGDIHRITGTLSEVTRSGTPYPRNVDALNRKMLDQIAGAHLARLARFSRRATRVSDKMPHNFLGLGLIDQLFPGARVIHCRRDPVDTCLSIYFQHFNAHHPYARDLRTLGIYYRQYLRLMEHWRSVLRIPMLEVDYEETVANQEAVSRAMVEFIGLRWDDACLRFFENKRITRTISYDQVRRPIYTQSVARWLPYARFLGPLLHELGVAPPAPAAQVSG